MTAPNFARLYGDRPEITRLMIAMLQAREALSGPSWSHPLDQVEELVGELEADALGPRGGFAGKLVQGAGQIVAGEAEQRHEARRQPAAVVEKVVDRIAHVELIAVKHSPVDGRRPLARPRSLARL